MTKKVLLFVFTVFMVATFTVFAAGQKESDESEEQVIVFQTFLEPGGDSPREQAWEEIIEGFTAETGIRVETNVMPWQEVDRQLILSTQAGNPPDVSFVRDKSFHQHMAANSLMPLDEFVERDFDEETKNDYLLWGQDGVYDGVKYVFRMHNTPVGLYIRKDLLEKTGLPAPVTWDDFIEVGKAISNESIDGFMFTGSPAQPSILDYIQPMIEGFGGNVIDENGYSAFNESEGVKAFSLLKSFVFDHGIAPKSTATARYDEVTDAFAAGRVAMIIEGAHRYNRVADVLGEDNILLAQIPRVDPDTPSPTSVSGWTLGIPKGSGNPEAAWEFIKYCTDIDAQLSYTVTGGQLPVRVSLLEDPYFSSDEGQVISWFVDYMNEAGSLAINPTTFQELSEMMSHALQKILSSENTNVEAILNETAKEYDALISK